MPIYGTTDATKFDTQPMTDTKILELLNGMTGGPEPGTQIQTLDGIDIETLGGDPIVTV